MDGTSVTFRPVSARDEDFLFEVYASTRAEELASLPLDASQRQRFLKMQFAAQQQDYKRRFPDADHQVILLEDRPIGRLYVARGDQEIRILDVALLPEHRNRGIGTRIITDLLDEAAQARQPLRVHVERFNPSNRLFERLGFAVVEDIGTHFLMESPVGK